MTPLPQMKLPLKDPVLAVAFCLLPTAPKEPRTGVKNLSWNQERKRTIAGVRTLGLQVVVSLA